MLVTRKFVEDDKSEGEVGIMVFRAGANRMLFEVGRLLRRLLRGRL